MRRTKIVCTIGPASDSPAMIRSLIGAGMDMARLNFSHGTYENHTMIAKRVRAAAKMLGRNVAIMQDLQGPKIRCGELPQEGVRLVKGSIWTFSTKSSLCDPVKQILGVSYAGLHHDLKAGDQLLLDDGLLELKVVAIDGHNIRSKVVVGGTLYSHKGINAPTATLKVDPLTEKDKKDLTFGLKLGVDWVALSFVTSAGDVKRLKNLITANWKLPDPAPKVIVKIEKHEALDHLEEILVAADGVMVARGDLGIETPPTRVPIEQKAIIGRARELAKPVIVATQMLDSMIRNPRPTRAEISDIANAVIDHTDACMLSGESASGKYPLEAVQVMAQTIEATEASCFDDYALSQDQSGFEAPSIFARVESAMQLALRAKAAAIVVMTTGGEKVRWASSLRQELPLVALVADDRTGRQLQVSWGVVVIKAVTTSALAIKRLLVTRKIIQQDQSFVLIRDLREAAGELIS